MPVNVQIDEIKRDQELGESLAIWSGQYAELPNIGALIEIRSVTPGGPGVYVGPARGESEFYIVLQHHWISFATPESVCTTAIVYVRLATSDETAMRLQLR